MVTAHREPDPTMMLLHEVRSSDLSDLFQEYASSVNILQQSRFIFDFFRGSVGLVALLRFYLRNKLLPPKS
jgi:hypothetical protein